MSTSNSDEHAPTLLQFFALGSLSRPQAEKAVRNLASSEVDTMSQTMEGIRKRSIEFKQRSDDLITRLKRCGLMDRDATTIPARTQQEVKDLIQRLRDFEAGPGIIILRVRTQGTDCAASAPHTGTETLADLMRIDDFDAQKGQGGFPTAGSSYGATYLDQLQDGLTWDNMGGVPA